MVGFGKDTEALHDAPTTSGPGEAMLHDVVTPASNERRKALAQVAFVRHSTSEIQQQLRTPDGRVKDPRLNASQEFSRYPGSLYNHDKPERKPPSAASSLPEITASPSRHTASHTDWSSLEATLNGIGHPVVLRNQSTSANGTRPPGELVNPATGAGNSLLNIDKLINGMPHHFYHSQRAKLLPSLHPKGEREGAGGSGKDDDKGTDGKPERHTLRRVDTLLGGTRHTEAAAPTVAIAKPLGQDTLNLWRGKRLTRLEMKVEQKLHVVRNNPVAKTDLQHRVHSYIEEKAQEQAERVALAELAAERREQKTLEFVGNRLKASVGNRPSTSSNSDALSSLFDRATGKPRNDCNPLPETSRSYWHGFLALAQKLGQLREALVERAEEKRQHAKEAQATTTIQRHWRGFQARRDLLFARTGKRASVARHHLKVTPEQIADAAAKVMRFMEFSHNAAVLGYLRKRFRERNSDNALGTVASAFLSMESIRSFRVQILMGQWQTVEARCIDCVKRRIRSNMIGELPPEAPGVEGSPARPKQTSVSGLNGLLDKRRLGGRALSTPDTQSSIKQVVAEALSKTFLSDRVVLEDLRTVPKPVKMATLQIFMQDRLNAYVCQLGLYWKKRTRFVKMQRANAVKAMAIHAIESFVPQARLSAAGDDQGNREAITELAENLGQNPDFEIVETLDPGPFPRYRALATLPELKALMQQAVAETPFFRQYLMRQQLQAYETQLTEELKDRYADKDEVTKKELIKRGRNNKVAAAMGRSPSKQDEPPRTPEADEGQQGGPSIAPPEDAPKTKSFTLALLLHRWHTECNPRILACLNKRWELMNVKLVTCLMYGKWLNHDDMGTKLMELREG